MIIHQNFTGGNIRVKEIDGDTVYLENELRDTEGDWFYWAFCAEGAAGRTVTFRFGPTRLGYWGPAVSHDLENWRWLGEKDGDSFTYTFAEGENRVYFAHNMLYHPPRLTAWAAERGLPLMPLCRSPRGREVPFFTFGGGEKKILLTARHHACESTGNYVLEGVLSSLRENLPAGFSVICVPFVDYDGVVDGDQGKNRRPHDHNRDYDPASEAVHSSCAAIRRMIETENIVLGFDFHSPYHTGGRNDTCFIVQKSPRLANTVLFGGIFADCDGEGAMDFTRANYIAPGDSWNKADSPATFAGRLLHSPSADVAFTLETAYFGTENCIFTADRGIKTGRRFAEAIRRYIAARGL